MSQEEGIIWHRNMMPTISIHANVGPGVLGYAKTKEIYNKLAEYRQDLPTGYTIDLDGSAEKSIERTFAEDLDAAEEVCVYAKLPRTFQIPTPVGNYSPDWAIAFYEGTVKHIFFVAETKGTMDSLELRPIEQAKISCAKKLFNEISTSKVRYHDVDSYQKLLEIMPTLR